MHLFIALLVTMHLLKISVFKYVFKQGVKITILHFEW